MYFLPIQKCPMETLSVSANVVKRPRFTQAQKRFTSQLFLAFYEISVGHKGGATEKIDT